MYSHVTASLQGLSVIRAFKVEEMVLECFNELQDIQTANWLSFISCHRWLGLRVDLLMAVYLAGVIYIGLILSNSSEEPYFMFFEICPASVP